MGGEPWHYFVPYQNNIQKALTELKYQEFLAARYGLFHLKRRMKELLTPEYVQEHFGNSPPWDIESPLWEEGDYYPAPKELLEKHGSFDAAVGALIVESGPCGTKSILDMTGLSKQPESGMACPLAEEDLQAFFSTTRPSRNMVEAILIKASNTEAWGKFWEGIDRGQGRYITLYENNEPTEIFWAGYSFD
ncbi:MAG: hypothetical protein AAF889_01065 [Cyanobacteria bacterium P01_D01_bin.73]